MTSVKVEISQEARRLLADRYIESKKPWFAAVILDSRLKQFDTPLSVITELLERYS